MSDVAEKSRRVKSEGSVGSGTWAVKPVEPAVLNIIADNSFAFNCVRTGTGITFMK